MKCKRCNKEENPLTDDGLCFSCGVLYPSLKQEAGFEYIEEKPHYSPEICCMVCDDLTANNNLGFKKRFILPNGIVLCYECVRLHKGTPIGCVDMVQEM